jgi:hypothetical protein
MSNRPRGAAIYDIDIEKYRFDVVSLDAAGAVRGQLPSGHVAGPLRGSTADARWHGIMPRFTMAPSAADRDGS